MTTTATLGPIAFGDGVADVNGAKWRLGSVDGWESPEIRNVLLDRSGGHGQAVASAFYGGRPLVLSGTVEVPSEAGYWASLDRLRSAQGQPGAVQQFTLNESIPKRCGVIRAGKPRLSPNRGAGGYVFEVPLLAPDPRLYAAAESSGTSPTTGTNQLVNTGTVETFPVFTITGTAANPITITNTTTPTGSKTVRINTALISTDRLVVDFATRRVYKNGVDSPSLVDPTSQWWALWPGKNLLAAHAASLEDPALGANGWSSASGTSTLARSTLLAAEGIASLAVKCTAAGVTNTAAIAITNALPVTGSGTYTWLASFAPTTTVRQVNLTIWWFNSVGTLIASTDSALGTEVSGSFLTRSIIAATAPGLATAAQGLAVIHTAALDEVHLVDMASFHAGSSPEWTPGQANFVVSSVAGTHSWHNAWA